MKTVQRIKTPGQVSEYFNTLRQVKSEVKSLADYLNNTTFENKNIFNRQFSETTRTVDSYLADLNQYITNNTAALEEKIKKQENLVRKIIGEINNQIISHARNRLRTHIYNTYTIYYTHYILDTIDNEPIIITVTVIPGESGNIFNLTPNNVLQADETYRFIQSDSTNSGHPFRIATSVDGPDYTTNVTYIGTPGQSGSYTELVVPSDYTSGTLFYKCQFHSGMGGAFT